VAKRTPKAAARAARPPLIPAATNRFERDVALMQRRGADIARFRAVIEVLCARPPLPRALNDHPLKGDWKGYRDCHVDPDWLIIYRATRTELILARTDTHADLFGK
jgi:mRNA interferase YafQ